MSSLPDLIQAARLAALSQEQALLRMLTQRKASRRVMTDAAKSYQRAADLMNEALVLTSTPREDTQ